MGKTRSSWLGDPFVAMALALPSGVVFAFYKAFPDRKIEPRPGAGWLNTIFRESVRRVLCPRRADLDRDRARARRRLRRCLDRLPDGPARVRPQARLGR